MAGDPTTITPNAPQSSGPIIVPPVAATPAPGAAPDLSSYASQYPASVISAAQAIFSAKPDQAQAFQTQYGGNLQAWLNSFTQWWSSYGSQVAGQMQNFQPEQGLLSALGYSQGQQGNWVAGPGAIVQPPPTSGTAPGTSQVLPVSQPTEEGIYNEVIGGLNNEILNDQNLANDTTNLENQTNTNYQTLSQVLGGAVAPPGGTSQVTDQENAAAAASANTQIAALGSAIAAQKQSLAQQIAALSGAADTASQQQLAALQNQLATLNQAESSVASARTAAAQGQVSAVNIALAQAKNQIKANSALQGFVGGSSMEDNALAQAGIGANAAAANDVGAATLQNAQDYQGITDLGANSTDAIQNLLSQQQQAIADQGANTSYSLDAALNQGTYGLTSTEAQQQQQNIQNQYGQSLQASLGLAALPGQQAQQIGQIDNLQNAGLLNAQNALNWWSAPASPPNPTTTTSTASTAGNTIAAAGTGLLGAAASIGNSNNWWQTPSSTPSVAANSATTAPFTSPTITEPSTSLIPQ